MFKIYTDREISEKELDDLIEEYNKPDNSYLNTYKQMINSRNQIEVIKVPKSKFYTVCNNFENIDKAIDYLFDNDIHSVKIKYYYDENENRMSIDDVFGYFGFTIEEFGYTQGYSNRENYCDIVIHLKDIIEFLDKEQIASIIKYLSNNNEEYISYK